MPRGLIHFHKIKTGNPELELLQSNLKSVFDSLDNEPFLGAKALGFVTLQTGVNLISHGLGKAYVSCVVSLPSANYAILEETQSPDRTKYIAITATAPATVQMWALTNPMPGIFKQAQVAVPGVASGYTPGDEGVFYAPTPAANWTHINWGAGTSLINTGRQGIPTVFLSDYTTGGAEIIFGAIDKVQTIAASAKYTLTCAFRPLLVPDNVAGHNSTSGIMITDGTKFITFHYVYVQSAMHMQVQEFSDANHTNGAPLYDQNFNFGINSRVWLQIQDDTVHRKFSFSVDGVNFIPPILSHASGTYLTEVGQGIMVSPINSVGAGITLESEHLTFP
jgi:hypothetical protein